MNNTRCYPLQPHQHPQITDLSLLNNNLQPKFVSTGLRLSSGQEQSPINNSNHHHRLHSQQFQQQQQQQDPGSSSSETIGPQLKRQHQELDGFLQAQGEELRRKLAKKRRRHYHALVSAVEQPLEQKLREKEAQVELVKRRHEELAARAAQLTAEAEAWRQRAAAHEAGAAQLQQAISTARRGQDAQDAYATEDAESGCVDPGRETGLRAGAGGACKRCGGGNPTVVILPCGHLCLCARCDQAARALTCPVCLQLTTSTLEAIFC